MEEPPKRLVLAASSSDATPTARETECASDGNTVAPPTSEPDLEPDSETTAMRLMPATKKRAQIRQVALMVDQHTTIPESGSVEDIILNTEETQVYADDFADADLDLKQEDSMCDDLFNKELTVFEIPDSMLHNLDALIEAQLATVRRSDYVVLEAASATLPGKKKGKSKRNQDALIMLERFGPEGLLQFFGVCDGHGPSGHHVSQYCAHKLPQLLVLDQQSTLTTLSKPAYALVKAFADLEAQLIADKVYIYRFVHFLHFCLIVCV